jgi:hypothetical protein
MGVRRRLHGARTGVSLRLGGPLAEVLEFGGYSYRIVRHLRLCQGSRWRHVLWYKMYVQRLIIQEAARASARSWSCVALVEKADTGAAPTLVED